MKTNTLHCIGFLLLLGFLVFTSPLKAQTKKTLTVLNVDAQNISYTPDQLGNLLRLEIERLDKYEVMDRYDVAYLIKKHDLDIGDCYGKICLVETGKVLNSQLMLSATVELYGETIIVSMRLIDVEAEVIEKTFVMEFLNIQNEMQTMIRISLHKLFNIEIDEVLVNSLTADSKFDNAYNNPESDRLNLSGPRMGATYFTGTTADILSLDKTQGGYNAYPLMFQFGYQFEKQYLNQGSFQALFEFLPTVTGLDQSMLIPSFTFMNGIRNTTRGWEFAMGPSISMVSLCDGYYTDPNKISTWNRLGSGEAAPDGLTKEKRMDSRGTIKDYTIKTRFIFAIGKTFRSGNLNVPVNFYFSPGKDGMQFGLSFGYNARKKRY